MSGADRWDKVGVLRIGRKVLGNKARAWVDAEGSRCLGVLLTKAEQPRLILAKGKTWAELAKRAFLEPLEAAERAKAAGFDVQSLSKTIREAVTASKTPREDQEA